MKFNTGFCTSDGVTQHSYEPEEWLEIHPAVGIWESGWHQDHSEPAVCLGSQEGKLHPGDIKHSTATWWREVMILMYSALVWSESCVQCWAAQSIRGRGRSQMCLKKDNKSASVTSAWETWVCPVWKRGDWGYQLISLNSFLRRSEEGGIDLFSLKFSDRRHRNGSVLHQERFRLTVGDISIQRLRSNIETDFLHAQWSVSVSVWKAFGQWPYFEVFMFAQPWRAQAGMGWSLQVPSHQTILPFFSFPNKRLWLITIQILGSRKSIKSVYKLWLGTTNWKGD